MQKQTQPIQISLALALGLTLIASSVSAEMYSWQTEDGGVAYTDDRDQIPARYASQAKRVGQGSLEQYKRFTPNDDAAQSTYASRLSERLAHLRAMNSEAPVAHAAASTVAHSGRTVSVATGNPSAPEIQVPVADGAGPLVVERVTTKQAGDSLTRRVTVIRQGGKTVAVVKGNDVTRNLSSDIIDEDELTQGNF